MTETADRLFLLSYSEIVETPKSRWSDYSWIGKEGAQYEAFKGKVTNNDSDNSVIAMGSYWWERSVLPNDSVNFIVVHDSGDPSHNSFARNWICVCPAWCF